MQINRLEQYYLDRKLSQAKFDQAVQTLEVLNQFCHEDNGCSVDEINTTLVDEFILSQRNCVEDALELLLIIGRYYRLIKRNDIYIHITKYLGKLNVLESIEERLTAYVDQSVIETIKKELEQPALLTTPDEMPSYLERIMNVYETHIDQPTLSVVLAGNHHKIPKEAFDDEIEYYRKANTLDEYLYDLHQRKIAELNGFLERNQVWYEQMISKRVIDYVASNQEILSAKRVGNSLFITKIPYDTEKYLDADSVQMKAYHACHCPFAKEAIRKGNVTISPTWCHCSGGFTKYQFDLIFGQELKVTPLELALKNDSRCRFEISLEGVNIK